MNLFWSSSSWISITFRTYSFLGWFYVDRYPGRHLYSRGILYPDFPKFYNWDVITRKWKKRKTEKIFSTVGSIHTIHPNSVDVFYLRMLLWHVSRATSFTHMRIYNGLEYTQYREEFIPRGLQDDNNERSLCMGQKIVTALLLQIRQLFTVMLVYGEPSSREQLMKNFVECKIEDQHYICHYEEYNASICQTIDDVLQLKSTLILYLLDPIVTEMGLGLSTVSLPISDESLLDIITSWKTIYRTVIRNNEVLSSAAHTETTSFRITAEPVLSKINSLHSSQNAAYNSHNAV